MLPIGFFKELKVLLSTFWVFQSTKSTVFHVLNFSKYWKYCCPMFWVYYAVKYRFLSYCINNHWSVCCDRKSVMIALGIIYAIVCMFRFSINAYQYLRISCYQQNICSMQYNGMQKKNVEMISAILMCFNATPCTLLSRNSRQCIPQFDCMWYDII
jgi:hypothetical protein